MSDGKMNQDEKNERKNGQTRSDGWTEIGREGRVDRQILDGWLVIKYKGDGPAKSGDGPRDIKLLKGVGHHRNGTTWRVIFALGMGSCICSATVCGWVTQK